MSIPNDDIDQELSNILRQFGWKDNASNWLQTHVPMEFNKQLDLMTLGYFNWPRPGLPYGLVNVSKDLTPKKTDISNPLFNSVFQHESQHAMDFNNPLGFSPTDIYANLEALQNLEGYPPLKNEANRWLFQKKNSGEFGDYPHVFTDISERLGYDYSKIDPYTLARYFPYVNPTASPISQNYGLNPITGSKPIFNDDRYSNPNLDDWLNSMHEMNNQRGIDNSQWDWRLTDKQIENMLQGNLRGRHLFEGLRKDL